MSHAAPRTLGLVVALGIFLTPVLASPIAAQELASGTWTGTIAPPGGEAMPIEYEVTGGDAPSIVLMLQGQPMPMENVELTAEALRFSFNPGVHVACELLPTDEGGYEGECLGDDGNSGVLTMVPPPNE